MGQLMVKSQEWLTSKNGFKMVSPMNFMVFKPQDLNPGQSSIFVMSRTTQKTTWVDFQIWSDHRCFFHDMSGTQIFSSYPPEVPHQLMLSRMTPLAFIRPARSCRSAKVVWAELQQLQQLQQLGMGQDVTVKYTAWCERFIKFIWVYTLQSGNNSPKCWIIR